MYLAGDGGGRARGSVSKPDTWASRWFPARGEFPDSSKEGKSRRIKIVN